MRGVLFVGLLLSFSGLVHGLEVTTLECESHSDDIYKMKDGTVFEKTGYGDIGYFGYNPDVIFLDGRTVCMRGEIYSYRMQKEGARYHYSRKTYFGRDAYVKLRKTCGD